MTTLLLAPLAIGLGADVRYLASLPPDFDVDAEGTRVGQSFVLDQRYRLALDVGGKGWKVAASGDVFTGQLVGDPWDIPGDTDARHRETIGVLGPDAFVPRTAYVEGRVGPTQFTGGLQTSHWGLGMVANDGAHEPLFGRSDFGDRVLRARVATMPLGAEGPVTLVAAFDRVVEDDTAEWADGQAAYQGVLALLWKHGTSTHGLYGVYRDQVEADAFRNTRVVMVDGFGAYSGVVGPMAWALSGEFAGIAGETSRARTYTEPETLRVASAGATARLDVGSKAGGVTGTLRAGWASGDGDPDDGASHDFAFDRDFDVGMVLFDEYHGAIEAAAYAQLSDPEHTGQTADGAEALVTEGAFRRAVFLQPVVSVAPLGWLDARAGVVAAWATAPIAQPFYTFRNGGTPTNHRDEPSGGRWIGAELDWALEASAPEDWVLRPSLLLQGGYALPSVADGNLERKVLSLHTATARLSF